MPRMFLGPSPTADSVKWELLEPAGFRTARRSAGIGGGFLAGWVERLRTRFLGAVVPAALSQPTVKPSWTREQAGSMGYSNQKFRD
jgi:hypothetical protein